MAAVPPICDFDWPAPAFTLPGVDGKTYSLSDVRGAKGTLIMFICNHCPYVKAIEDRLVADIKSVQELGIGVAAVMSNDATQYPEDAPENLKRTAERLGFSFPYLYDESQEVGRAYGAVCTPDFFGFNGDLGLQYRGRLDASMRQAGPPGGRRELVEAMALIAATGRGPEQQTASMGCSIKWRAA